MSPECTVTVSAGSVPLRVRSVPPDPMFELTTTVHKASSTGDEGGVDVNLIVTESLLPILSLPVEPPTTSVSAVLALPLISQVLPLTDGPDRRGLVPTPVASVGVPNPEGRVILTVPTPPCARIVSV